MPGAWTTKSILDGSGASISMRVWDESGAGTGPFSFGQVIGDGLGSGNAVGGLTETAPATDTGSSGLNGRLQRVAQRLTTLIALIPAALGQTTKSGSMSVTLASDDDKVGTSREFAVVGTTLTRPANTTAYSAGDAISDNATAGSVTAQPVTVSDVNDAPLTLTDIILDTTDTGLAAGINVDVFVYNSDPTASTGVGGGDNAAFSNKRAGFVGRFRGTFVAFSDGGKAICRPVDGDNALMPVLNTKPGSGAKTLWLQYKANAGFTPSGNSTTIIPTVRGFQGRA